MRNSLSDADGSCLKLLPQMGPELKLNNNVCCAINAKDEYCASWEHEVV